MLLPECPDETNQTYLQVAERYACPLPGDPSAALRILRPAQSSSVSGLASLAGGGLAPEAGEGNNQPDHEHSPGADLGCGYWRSSRSVPGDPTRRQGRSANNQVVQPDIATSAGLQGGQAQRNLGGTEKHLQEITVLETTFTLGGCSPVRAAGLLRQLAAGPAGPQL